MPDSIRVEYTDLPRVYGTIGGTGRRGNMTNGLETGEMMPDEPRRLGVDKPGVEPTSQEAVCFCAAYWASVAGLADALAQPNPPTPPCDPKQR